MINDVITHNIFLIRFLNIKLPTINIVYHLYKFINRVIMSSCFYAMDQVMRHQIVGVSSNNIRTMRYHWWWS